MKPEATIRQVDNGFVVVTTAWHGTRRTDVFLDFVAATKHLAAHFGLFGVEVTMRPADHAERAKEGERG